MIDFEHVSKEYKKGGPLALEDINFHVDEGEFVFLLGHSGAGKSTLLKLILREETPTEGKVTVLGKDVARLRRHQVPYLRRQMGIIFQDFRLIPSMTVYENVAFAMHVTNVKHKEIADRVDYMLELVHLEDKASAYPDTLSGGESQRIKIAAELAKAPSWKLAEDGKRALFILDEPTSGLHFNEVALLLAALFRLRDAGHTILCVEHHKDLLNAADYLVDMGPGSGTISWPRAPPQM